MTGVAFSGVTSAAGTETPRSYFRRYLAEHTASSSDLRWYFDEALAHIGESDEVRLALEEIVDRIGRLVGFEVTRDDRADYSAWTSRTGHQILVWVVDRAGAISSIGSASRARDARLVSEHVTQWSEVTCLLVVCGPVNQRGLGDALVLRRAGDHQRFATADALQTLAGLHQRQVLSHDGVLAVLKPPSAFVDPLVALVDDELDGRARSANDDGAEQREDRR